MAGASPRCERIQSWLPAVCLRTIATAITELLQRIQAPLPINQPKTNIKSAIAGLCRSMQWVPLYQAPHLLTRDAAHRSNRVRRPYAQVSVPSCVSARCILT